MCAAPRPNLRRLLDLGYRARGQGDRSAALGYFEMALAANPEHIEARMQTARELWAMSRLEEAETMFRQVVSRGPDRVRALVALGQVLRELSRFDEAEDLLQHALKLAPSDFEALRCLARLARQRGDRASALAYLERAAAADTVQVGVLLDIAAELRDQGQFDEAHRKIDLVLQREPQNHKGWMQLGQLERRRGNHSAALDAFNRVVSRHPDQIQALVEVAIEERALGRPKESEQALKRALAMDSKHLGALMQCAEHAWLAEKDQESLAYCQRAIAAHPRSLWPYLNSCRALACLAKGEAAFALLDYASSVFDADPAIAARRVDLLRQAGLWQEARAVLAECSADAQRHFGLWALRVQLDIKMGDYASAAEALRSPPTTSTHEVGRACMLRGQVAEAQWQHEEAAALYRQAIQYNGSDSIAHSELARACLLMLDVDAAREHLRASTRLHVSMKLLRGQSLNPSQSMLGQILNEFVLDRAVLEQLLALRRVSLSERVKALPEIVRRFPDNTAAAVSLLIAMRQAGVFGKAKSDPSRRAAMAGIPQRIMQYWDAAVPPAYIMEIMQSWRELNPALEYKRFEDKSAREFIAAKYPTDVLRAYIRVQHPAQKADLFRLAYLAAEGGFYTDADDRCIAPIASIVPTDASLVVYQENLGTIGNNFLGVTAGEPAIRCALDLAVTAINRGDHENIWLSTGPGLISRVVAQLLSDPATSSEFLDRALVFDRGELAKAVAVNCQLSYKRTAKHWVRGASTQAKPSMRQRRGASSIAGGIQDGLPVSE